MKTQLKSVWVIYCFLHKTILHKVKSILWKCNIDIFNIDWNNVKDWNQSVIIGLNQTLMLVI